jgi:hypothetical protein
MAIFVSISQEEDESGVSGESMSSKQAVEGPHQKNPTNI